MATADFKINTSVQADRGYDATNSEAITLTLENAPAVDVYKVVYSVVTASDGAPAITFSPGSGQPTTPTGNVTFTTTGSGFHSYLIQCQANDGKRQTDRGLVVDAGYTKQRMIVIRGALTNLRKTVPAETTQYGSDGWNVALNELADAVENGSVGGISTAEPIVTYGAAPTIPNAVDLTAITTTVAAASTTVQPVAVRLNPSTNDTVLDVFSLRRSTTHASNGATGIGARMFVELEDSAGNVDSAAQHIWDYLDATSTSEDARYTIRLQVAGSLTDALSLRGTTVRVPALAGGGARTVTVDNNGDLGAAAASGLDANAHVLEDATTALGVNGVPMRAAPSTVGFVGVACAPISLTHKTAAAAGVAEGLRLIQQINAGGVGNPGVGGEAVKLAFALPNGSGAETLAASVRGEWTTVIGGGTSKLVLATALAGTETDRATLGGTGLWRWHAYGVGRILSDASGNLTSAAITFTEVQTALAAASGDIAVNSQKITGLANGSSSSDAAAFGQIAVAVSAAVSGTSGKVPKFTGANTIGNSTISDDGTNVSITGSFTASGFIGVSIDRATSGTFTFGTNVTTIAATAVAMTGVASLANSGGDITCTPNASNALVGRKDALTTTYSTCVAARNATAATSLATVQTGPVVSSEGTGWRTSSGGASLTVRGGFVTVPVSGSIVATRVYRVYDSGTGSYAVLDYSTDLDPYLFGAALVFGTAIFTLNGLRDAIDGNGGIRKNSTHIQLTSGGSNEVQLATNSTVRHAITSTGAVTCSKNTSAVTRVQHGTAGVNYIDLTGTAVTVTASGTGTLYTIATVSNSYVDVEVRGFAYHIGTAGNVRAFGVRCAFKNIAGTVTDGAQENIRTPDDLGTAWGTPPTVTLAHSGTDILITGAAAGATDTRFILTKIEWFVGTTSA